MVLISCIFLWIKIISINRIFFHSSFFLTILTSLVIKHIHHQLPTGIRTLTLMTSIGKTLSLRCFTHWCTNLDLFMLFFIVVCFSIQFLKILCYTFLHVLTIITKKLHTFIDCMGLRAMSVLLDQRELEPIKETPVALQNKIEPCIMYRHPLYDALFMRIMTTYTSPVD